ncbi:hypothetical protein ACFO0N_01950 [Halobium salinum]|uniref:Uncharacterized protein n=1 Tax=Halobium salinum TaxID=1364940 RepID=A0ABD5P872_9EURY|nr:hypothetical protein [Halobium salinum]
MEPLLALLGVNLVVLGAYVSAYSESILERRYARHPSGAGPTPTAIRGTRAAGVGLLVVGAALVVVGLW